MAKGRHQVRIIHFNDVYNVESRKGGKEPIGGINRFATLVQALRESQDCPAELDSVVQVDFVTAQDFRPEIVECTTKRPPKLITSLLPPSISLPFREAERQLKVAVDGQTFDGQKALVLFSGDCLSPSVLSSITKGKHMAPGLNLLGVDVACWGNHDFDFGISQMLSLHEKWKFPWLLANLIDPISGAPIARSQSAFYLDVYNTQISLDGSEIDQQQSIRVGFIGLAENWLASVPALDEKNVRFVDAVQAAREAVEFLKYELSPPADVVIALTHGRQPFDINLASTVAGIDVILGGHDHSYYSHFVSRRPADSAASTVDPDPRLMRSAELYHTASSCFSVTSGSDFKSLSSIVLTLDLTDDLHRKSPLVQVNCRRFKITSSLEVNPQLDAYTNEWHQYLSNKLQQPLAESTVVLDALFETVRSKESNICNFIADAMRSFYNTDLALLTGGSVRAEKLIPSGVITMEIIMELLPFAGGVSVAKLKGSQIRKMLEVSVSSYPVLEGRFLHPSGLSYVFNPNLSVGNRIVDASLCNGFPILEDAFFSVATLGFVLEGNDGFQFLRDEQFEMVVSSHEGLSPSSLLRSYFESLKVLQPSLSEEDQSLIRNSQLQHKLVSRIYRSPRQSGDLDISEEINSTPDLFNDRALIQLISSERFSPSSAPASLSSTPSTSNSLIPTAVYSSDSESLLLRSSDVLDQQRSPKKNDLHCPPSILSCLMSSRISISRKAKKGAPQAKSLPTISPLLEGRILILSHLPLDL